MQFEEVTLTMMADGFLVLISFHYSEMIQPQNHWNTNSKQTGKHQKP